MRGELDDGLNTSVLMCDQGGYTRVFRLAPAAVVLRSYFPQRSITFIGIKCTAISKMSAKKHFWWKEIVSYWDSCVNLVVLFFNKFTVTVVAQINLNLSQRQAAALQTEKQSPQSSQS